MQKKSVLIRTVLSTRRQQCTVPIQLKILLLAQDNEINKNLKQQE